MKRSAPLRRSDGFAKLTVPVFRPRRCKACKEQYTPAKQMQCVCSPECGQEIAKVKREKAERKADRIKREKLKTRSDYLKEAQREFNRYIRLRDASRPCICCGQPLKSGLVGGGYDAGHYRSVGSAPHLRFDERNVHAQRKQCNRWGAGRAIDYRLGLIGRIGQAAVEAIERDQTPRNYSADDLKAIRDKYRRLARELKNGGEK